MRGHHGTLKRELRLSTNGIWWLLLLWFVADGFGIESSYPGCEQASRASAGFELDSFAIDESAESVAFDDREMHEDIGAFFIVDDEAKAFSCIEPLNRPYWHVRHLGANQLKQ